MSKLQASSRTHTKSRDSGLGAPYWLAPEIIRNEKETVKADVYSFSIVLWECFHQEIPHASLTPAEACYAVAHSGLRPGLKKGLNVSVANTIRRCWKNRPEDRPEFDEILDLLVKIHDTLEAGSRESIKSRPGDLPTLGGSKQFNLPLNSPLANYILGTAGPRAVFFSGESPNVSDVPLSELQKIAKARASGRRASLGSIGTGSEKLSAVPKPSMSQEYPARRNSGESVTYGPGAPARKKSQVAPN